MSIHSSTLTAVHSMRYVGAVVAVGITNTPHTRQARAETRVSLGIDLTTEHLQSHLLRDRRGLLSGEVGDERVPVHGVTLGEVQTENIILAALVILVLLAVLDALDTGDSPVVETDVVRLHDLLPVGVVLGQDLLLRVCLRAVEEGDDVAVQRAVDFQHAADDVLETAEDTEGLVAVLIAVAPGAPVHALTPGLVETGGVGQDIAQTGTQDDLASGVLLAVGVGGFEGVVNGFDGGDGVVDDGRGVVAQDLLASCAAEVGGDGS